MSTSSPPAAGMPTTGPRITTTTNATQGKTNGGVTGLVTSPSGSKATASTLPSPVSIPSPAVLSPLFSGPMSPIMNNFIANAIAIQAATNGGNKLLSPPSSISASNGTGHKSPPNNNSQQLSPTINNNNNGGLRPMLHSSLQEICKAKSDRENPEVLKMHNKQLAQELVNLRKQNESLKKDKDELVKSAKEDLEKTKKELEKAKSKILTVEESLKKRDNEHAKQMADLKIQNEKDRAQSTRIHAEEVKGLKRIHQKAVDNLQNDFDKQLQEARANHHRHIEQLEENIKKKDTLIQGYERSMVEQIAATQNHVEPTQRPGPASKKTPKKLKPNEVPNNNQNHESLKRNQRCAAASEEDLSGFSQDSTSSTSATGSTAVENEVRLITEQEAMCNGYHSNSSRNLVSNRQHGAEIRMDESGNDLVNEHVIKPDPEKQELDEMELTIQNTSGETLPSMDSSDLMSPSIDGDVSEGTPVKKSPGKMPKKKEGKFGSGEPGFIFCEICGRLQWYSHMQRRYGCFSCEPCYKFYKRYLADPKQYKCEHDSNCSLKITGDRNLASARCKACWLVACKSNFTDGPTRKPRVLDPNAKLEKKLKSPNPDDAINDDSPNGKKKEKKPKNIKLEEIKGEGQEGKRGRPVKIVEGGVSTGKSAKLSNGPSSKKKERKKSVLDGTEDLSMDGSESESQGKKSTGKGQKRGRPLKRTLFDAHSHDPSPSSSTSTSTCTYPTTTSTSTSDESCTYDPNTSSSTSGGIAFQDLTLHLPPPPAPTQLVHSTGGLLLHENAPSDPNAQYHLLTSTPSSSGIHCHTDAHEEQMDMSGLKACGLCGEFESIERGPLITCSTCPLAGHAGCLDCPADLFEKILSMSSWRCPQCLPHA